MPASSAAAISAVSAFAVTSDSWSETQITWKSRPPVGARQSRGITSTVPGYVEWDVSAFVKAKLAAMDAGTVTRIHVDTYEGIVYLTGGVTSSEMKRQEEKTAREVPGVEQVVNLVRDLTGGLRHHRHRGHAVERHGYDEEDGLAGDRSDAEPGPGPVHAPAAAVRRREPVHHLQPPAALPHRRKRSRSTGDRPPGGRGVEHLQHDLGPQRPAQVDPHLR